MADTVPGDKSTTVAVTVGSTTNGTLDSITDHDWYKITLTKGQSITVQINGVTLEDPYLVIHNAQGGVLYENDDISSGVIRDSKLSFSATYTGVYYIDVGSYAEEYAGTFQVVVSNYTPPPLATVDQLADQLVNGYWSGDNHHFAVTQGGTINVNLTGLTAPAQTLARAALDLWSDVIGVNFHEVTSGGQIIFNDDGAGAYTDANWSNGIIDYSTVNVSADWLTTNGTGLNSYSFQTFVHEIGHALGLGHEGNYNDVAAYPYDSSFQNDAWSTSVMSYFSQQDNTYFAGQGFSYLFAVTPMMADIAAMQTLYGLSTITRTGDTTYGFNSNAGRAVFDATQFPDVAYTIFDSGGIDTLDYSGFGTTQSINLNPETFSNVGGKTGNVSIGRSVVIENAIGGTGADTITGNGVANWLQGNAGNDTLNGGSGDDRLSGGSGTNALNGGSGSDTADYSAGVTAAVSANLGTGAATYNAGAAHDNFNSVENIRGSVFSDTLTGDGNANVIEGNLGNDTLDGAAGLDTVSYANASAGVTVNLATAAAQNTVSAGSDTLSNFENILGSDFNDTLSGNGLANVITGGAGNDSLDGAGGADTLAGGFGDDIYAIDNAGDVISEAGGEGIDQANASVSYALGVNVENLTLTGSSSIDGTGNGINNVITGNSGANSLDGGGGADTLAGGLGNDIYLADASDTIVENPGEGTDTVLAGATYSLAAANVENLTLTGASAINGTGSAGDNVIRGNSNANLLDGGAGDDTLIANGGNDSLVGGAGFDQMYGGAGNDTYYANDLTDFAYEDAGEGNDLVIASVDHHLRDNIEGLTLTGAAYIGQGNGGDNTITGSGSANKLYGNEGDDSLSGMGGDDYLYGNDGNDTLDGGAGIDRMLGGTGDDTFYYNEVTDYAYENAGEGYDTVLASINYILRVNFEELDLTGTASKGYGNSVDNLVIGNSANNFLYGRDGNDTVRGGVGNDIVYGENGNDTLEGGAGTDRYYGGAGADKFVFRNGDFGGLSSATADRLHDFNEAEGDLLHLANVDANSLLAGDQAFSFIGSASFGHHAGELRAYQQSGVTWVQGDTNGDGAADFLIRIDGLHTLTPGDNLIL